MAHTDHHTEQRQHKAARRADRLYNARPRLRAVDLIREQLEEPDEPEHAPIDCEAVA